MSEWEQNMIPDFSETDFTPTGPERDPVPEGVYALMMDALDGELAEDGWMELEAHLRAYPELAREWDSWQAVDQLFRATPAVAPALEFTERTLARLPNLELRVWATAGIYTSLLLLGGVPLALAAWFIASVVPVYTQPSVIRSITVFFSEIANVAATVGGALLSGSVRLISEQPYLLGWLFVMAGAIFLWSAVYQQLVRPQVSLSRQRI